LERRDIGTPEHWNAATLERRNIGTPERKKSQRINPGTPRIVVHFSARNTKYSKFANFTGLYFSYFTTFRDQTWQFY
jgi:hypothetical protein